MAKNYTTKTASLKAITIDVHKLEANNLKIDGEDVLQKIDTTKSEVLESINTTKSEILGELDTVKQDLLYEIDNAVPTVKISTDTRETITENDLWGTYVETKDNGEIVIHDDFISNPNASLKSAWLSTITKVTNNKAYSTNNSFYANVQTEKIQSGFYMFSSCSNLTSVESDFSSLENGERMFYRCGGLISFYNELSSLSNGTCMFASCYNLVNFTPDLSSLNSGSHMFYNCSALKAFSSDLSSLNDGSTMFHDCFALTAFHSDLSSLINGSNMFNGCTTLTEFTSDLNSLISAERMFNGCKTLTSFTSSLSSLENGSSMFSGCKLNPRSVMHIVETLPQRVSNTTITIGIDITNDASTVAQQLQTFAQEVFYDSWNDLKQAFINKNWSVTWQFGGTSSSITLSEDEQFRGIPVYAKLSEEVSEELGEYCTEDGQHFYNIEWGHDVTHPEDFTYFGSLLEACGYYGVIPKIYLEEV